MFSYKKYVNVILFLIILLVSFNNQHNPFMIHEHPVAIEVNKSNDTLYKKIKEVANDSTYRSDPQDAYIDRVWKKTPGITGKTINIEASYEQMQTQNVFNEDLLVYKQIRPKISLEDLPAAPIYRGHPEKQMVAFIINVSWGGEHIPRILEILKEHQVKATFFIEGKWARENADLVKMIDDEEHIIGNHAYSHPDMARLNSEEIIKEITQTNEILTAITSKQVNYFTPPSGSFTDEVVSKADDLDLETILWTADTVDWKNPSVSVMINRVEQAIHPGAIVLMHPTPVIAEGLDQLIESIKEKHLKIRSISRLLDEER